jgi:hypothetical protein
MQRRKRLLSPHNVTAAAKPGKGSAESACNLSLAKSRLLSFETRLCDLRSTLRPALKPNGRKRN